MLRVRSIRRCKILTESSSDGVVVVVQRFYDVIWHTGRRRLSWVFYIIWPNGSFYILYIFLLSFFHFFPFFHFFSLAHRLFFFSRICFFALQLFFSISTYTIIYNRAIYNGSNNMWTYLHSDLLTLYISIIKTIYNYTLNMNLYNVHPYIYLHVYAPNAYDTISLTLSFDNSITTVEQVN